MNRHVWMEGCMLYPHTRTLGTNEGSVLCTTGSSPNLVITSEILYDAVNDHRTPDVRSSYVILHYWRRPGPASCHARYKTIAIIHLIPSNNVNPLPSLLFSDSDEPITLLVIKRKELSLRLNLNFEYTIFS